MGEHADRIISYFMGLMFLLFSTILAHASEIMAIGGLILLALRLYVDGHKALATYKERRRDRTRS